MEPMGAIAPRGSGQIDDLMGQASRLHEEIEVLMQKLTPVRTQSPEKAADYPQEAPQNRLHEGTLLVQSAADRLHDLHLQLNL